MRTASSTTSSMRVAAERQAVLAEIVADLNQPHDPGTIRPTRLEDWADSRLMRITFPQP